MTALHSGFLALGYLLGSLPFGVWVAKRYGVDILNVGSGNPGATNIWRTLGPKPGLVVFFLDVVKGVVPAVLAGHWLQSTEWAFGAGVCAVVGHTLSPFLKFRGGKGVATGFGALLGALPLVGLGAFAIFLIILAITRYVSLASICAALALVALGWFSQVPWSVLIVLTVMGLFVVIRHTENMKRLMNGTERKFELRKRKSDATSTDSPSESSSS